MKTVSELLPVSASYLQERGIDRPKRVAEELLAGLLGVKRLDLYMQYDRPLEEKEVALFREAIRRARKKEPVLYILGSVDFLDCTIGVSRDVLIPRPETEVLVAAAIEKIREKGLEKGICWDLCTGSGCIGISVKRALPEITVILSDISEAALRVARANGERNGLNIETRQGDLLDPFKGEMADIIFCNPPYITESEYLNLDPSVKDFEPRLALVGGESGLEYYERLSAELEGKLRRGGVAFFEIGRGQGEGVKKLFSSSKWPFSEVKKDWAGHDRFFFLEKQ